MVSLDELIAGAYWDWEIAPTLVGIPAYELFRLRSRYIQDVLSNPKALEQAREWVRGLS